MSRNDKLSVIRRRVDRIGAVHDRPVARVLPRPGAGPINAKSTPFETAVVDKKFDGARSFRK
jgi:hypothetical protein